MNNHVASVHYLSVSEAEDDLSDWESPVDVDLADPVTRHKQFVFRAKVPGVRTILTQCTLGLQTPPRHLERFSPSVRWDSRRHRDMRYAIRNLGLELQVTNLDLELQVTNLGSELQVTNLGLELQVTN
ncbi:hypothetical protein Btru_042904 [Bulinus truncatus]|nr:hypothetical protein Btru_042904 [Bulinus truncatus]